MPAFDILFGAFGAGVYFIVAVVHFDLWLRRRERRGHLWLALTSGSALIVDITGIAIPFAPPWTTKPLLGLNALGVAGATTCLLELVSAPNRAVTSARVRRFQAMVLLAAPSDLARASGATPRRPRSHHPQEGLQRARSLPSGHGTVAVDMDPLSLLCRLATSVPLPRFHTIHYAGVLAAASPWRSRLAPPLPSTAEDVEPEKRVRKSGYRPWAELLQRTFSVDVPQGEAPRCSLAPAARGGCGCSPW